MQTRINTLPLLVCMSILLVLLSTPITLLFLILIVSISLYFSCITKPIIISRQAQSFVFALTMSFIFSGIILIRLNNNGADYGLEMSTISSFTGILKQDSKTRGNYKEYLVTLERVHNRERMSASAKGSITVRIRSGPDISAGKILRVYTSVNSQYPTSAVIEQHGYNSRFWEIRARVMEGIRGRIRMLPDESAALFRALFLGERDELGAILIRYFRSAGIIHVLALSGMHLAVLIGACQLITRPILGNNYAMVIGLVVGALYIMLVGPIPSLMRAYTMYALAIFSRMFDYPVSPLSIIAGSTLILVLIIPSILLQTSFQLSTLAVWGIICIGTRIFDHIRSIIPLSLAASISASLGALIATAPISMYVFGSIYPSSIIASIFVNIIISVFFLLALVLIAVPLLGFALAPLLSILYSFLKTIAMWCSRIPELNTPVHFFVFILWAFFCIIILWRSDIAIIVNTCRGKALRNT